jgi:hypothetical protein
VFSRTPRGTPSASSWASPRRDDPVAWRTIASGCLQ